MKVQLRTLRSWLTTAFCALGLYAVPAFAQRSPIIVLPPQTNNIGFNNLSGANLDLFSTYTEGDFTISNPDPTNQVWFKAFAFGNPVPDIFLGPLQHPVTGVLRITDSADRFVFAGFDFSSNNGDSSFEVEGFRGLTKVFDETGSLLSPNFQSYSSLSSTTDIDALLIHIFPGPFATSVNIDNIRVTTIPEPSVITVFAVGIVGLVVSRRAGRK